MSYYEDKNNVEAYVKMAEGYDGSEFVPILRRYLPDEATLLELGIGPGVDMDILSKHFRVTGSDYSQLFLDRYRQTHPEADLVKLDAVTMQIDRKFDGIYSNKVLHQLTRDELQQSLTKQLALLKPNGILFHSFWAGDKTEEISGMRFEYYTEATLTQLLQAGRVVEMKRFSEMELDDSFYCVIQR